MSTIEKPAAISVDPEIQAAVDHVLKRVRDPEVMRRAAERIDRMREEMRQRVGNVDLAVLLIRDTRWGMKYILDSNVAPTFPFITSLLSASRLMP